MRFSLLLVMGFLTACSTLPMSFTSDNIMKVHQGMSSSEVLTMFGKPKSVTQTTCGGSTGKPWACTVWGYGEFPYDRATFMFSGDTPDSLILNNFEINKK